jgi:hypothetical protein
MKIKRNFTVAIKFVLLIQNAKILGLTISSNLKWTNHINEVIKKANKRLYFIILLKPRLHHAQFLVRHG